MNRSPIPRRTPLKRLSPMRHISSDKRKQDRLRARVRGYFMDAHPTCERCGKPSTDCHEIIRRSQAKNAAIRPALFVALCRACHQWATEHPTDAHEAGYVLHAWEDNAEALEAARRKRRAK